MKSLIEKIIDSNKIYEIVPIDHSKKVFGITIKIKYNRSKIKHHLIQDDRYDLFCECSIYVATDAQGIDDKYPVNIDITTVLFEDQAHKIYEFKPERSLRIPLNIESENEYYYHKGKDSIVDNRNRIINEKIVAIFFNKHILPTKVIIGFPLRLKIFFLRYVRYFLIAVITYILRFINFLISGYKYKKRKSIEDIHIDHMFSLNQDIISQPNENTFSLWGINIKKWSAVSYSFLHLVLAFTFFYFDFLHYKFIKLIFDNIFLTTSYAVVTLAIYDKLLPKFLDKSIIKLAKTACNCKYCKIQV
jgi:hypothetical protein